VITGWATPETTAESSRKQPGLDYNILGRTALRASAAGFGCYRVSKGIAQHERALRKALLSGINIIDTSANYADGQSEALVGKVLSELVSAGRLAREEIIVVTKVGYLQGQNFALSRQRKSEGRPFPELVEYGQGLEHCIHPAFLADQLERSLKRLNLETIDGYLLHNPEYYLEWSAKNNVDVAVARTEYYRRIQAAFEFFEEAVKQGRIRFYGVSSNTFVSGRDDHDFTCLQTICQIAEKISAEHHFRLIQLPMNLLEPGAVLESNQPGGQSALHYAGSKRLGVLINRPLNAFAANRLVRLADIDADRRQSSDDIIGKIRGVQTSENRLWKKILPDLDIMDGLKTRIRQQVAISDTLKHYYLNFGSYENFRQLKENRFMPLVSGVMDFLDQNASENQDVRQWMTSHKQALTDAFDAVASIYAEKAAKQIQRIRHRVDETDRDWAAAQTMSRKAIRAIRSTAGVTSVLVGMRREPYVEDVLEDLKMPVTQQDRTDSWKKLQQAAAGAPS
jgi:aryl-alcohol dehydrogenase-like predicted oxidoreductase